MSDSWHLKIKRAEKHLKELDTEVSTYAPSRPYIAERVVQPKGKKHIWQYVVRIMEQPDLNIAIIVGDVLHNARSALDHIVVASVPSSRRPKASFRIEFQDIFARSEDGSYLVKDDEARTRFDSALRGIHPDARTLIETFQPYRMGAQKVFVDPLGILSRLENADKHRALLTLGSGVHDGKTIVRVRDTVTEQNPFGFRGDGAIIANFRVAKGVQESEVNVEISGPMKVVIKVRGVPGVFEVMDTLEFVLLAVKDMLAWLDPYVRR